MSTSFRRWWHERGRCSHVSHRLGLWCWRPWTYQYRCGHHNNVCVFNDPTHCPQEYDRCAIPQGEPE